MITRFAPTPSGYLHAGNAVNALLVSWLAKRHDGQVALRIDDMDSTRARPEFVADIFDVLRWLRLDWQIGPTDPQDFAQRFSTTGRTGHYRRELEAARSRGLEVYACACTRRDVTTVPTGGCPGGCRTTQRAYTVDATALRVHVPKGTRLRIGSHVIALDEAMGDFVIWRRDDLPAYQLASLIEDRDLGTTHVVRGADLLESTAAQLFLAPYFAADAFGQAEFIHHPLITGASGEKFSKSQSRAGGPLERSDDMRDRVRATAVAVGAQVGVSPRD